MLDPKKILIIATRQIGDVMITTPLIRRARQIWPKAAIDLLGYHNTVGMLFQNPDIREVIECPEHPKWPEYRRLLGKILRRYDLSIISQPSDRAHLYGFLAAPRRIGIIPTKPIHNWWKRLLCERTITLNYETQHVVSERFNLLQGYDSVQDRIPEIVPPSKQPLPHTIRDLLRPRYIVIHATPRWRFKRWPVSNWAELISEINKYGIQVVLTGSNAPQDKLINTEIFSAVEGLQEIDIRASALLNLTGQLTLAQTGLLISESSGYVGVDTSVTHLAAACNAKTIALFGPTPPTNYGPWPINFSGAQPWQRVGIATVGQSRVQSSGNVCIIQGPGDCVPCRQAGCLSRFESHSKCLDSLSSSEVFESVFSHLNLSNLAQ
jgi:heptosyltransferase-3